MRKHQHVWNEDILLDADISLIDNEFDLDISITDGVFDTDFAGISVEERESPISVDSRSIDFNNYAELELVNYPTAAQGQYPTYDATQGLVWKDPLSTAVLEGYVEAARVQAGNAARSAEAAGNSEARSAASAAEAQAQAEYVDNKFWFGTITEYNALDYINPDTVYVILT